MAVFEFVLVLLLAAVGLSALSRFVKVPYPTLLALAGAGIALLPIENPLRLDPRLALALFVAPILLDAGYDTSLRDLKANWLPLTSLVLIAVGVTTAAVALVARTLDPHLSWAAAVALGALVAPPDAAAATAILRQVRLPYRIGVVLGGESLLNDASALLIYKLAVGAALSGGGVDLGAIAPAFLLSVAGSLIAGPLLAVAYVRLTRKLEDAPSAIVMQFVGTFGVWLIAERLAMSPILTVVAYAITIAQVAPFRTPARLRVPSYAVWETAVLVLNTLAFVVIGLQLRPILAHSPPGELWHWVLFSGAALATVIVVRFAWVMTHAAAVRLANARFNLDSAHEIFVPSWRGSLVVSWSGMRGIVTLAAALALPQNFPDRDLLLLTAFVVTLGTLVIQGLTLRPLLIRLAIPDDGLVEREVRLARVELAAVALQLLHGDAAAEAGELRRDLEAQRRIAEEASEGDGRAALPVERLRQRTLTRRRERLLELRRSRVIGDDAFHRLEEELDFADLATNAGT